MLRHKRNMSRKEGDANLDFACEAVMNRATEHNLVALLDKWSTCWSTVAALEPSVRMLMKSLSASLDTAASLACLERLPNQTWTSIAVLYNPSMLLHRDILNMIGHANHAITLGNFMEGRVWIEDENGQATALLETKSGQKLLRGTWVDMHDKPVSFNARKYHMLEKHRGNMWALAAIRLKHTNMLMNLMSLN